MLRAEPRADRPAGDQPAGEDPGRQMLAFIAELYPICRSITGEGVRETLRRIAARIPLERHAVPSGTRAFDWTVPPEWTIRDAYIADASGARVVDFRRSNLHVVSYSVPVARRMTLGELRGHLHSLPEHPDWIPYRTAYYREDWGFCLPDRQLAALPEGEYEVVIDATLQDGRMDYGECLIRGRTDEEVLISTHICHPSLANDNLSGIAVAVWLAQELARAPRRYSYRLLFIPGTIGAIAWLAGHEAELARIRHGLVLAGVGDPGPLTYKRSRRGNAEVDRAMAAALRHAGIPYEIVDFSPYGHDERQYCSPGFDLPVGSLSRTPHGRYPQYHTSADDLAFVRPEALAGSLAACRAAIEILEGNRRYRNTSPKGEPQLGRRGLYAALGGAGRQEAEMAMLWVLNLSDGRHDLLDVCERSALAFPVVHRAAAALERAGLLAPVETVPPAPEGPPREGSADP